MQMKSIKAQLNCIGAT